MTQRASRHRGRVGGEGLTRRGGAGVYRLAPLEGTQMGGPVKPTVMLDPRIFEQIAALPQEDAIKELRALVQLAEAGYIAPELGTRAALVLQGYARPA